MYWFRVKAVVGRFNFLYLVQLVPGRTSGISWGRFPTVSSGLTQFVFLHCSESNTPIYLASLFTRVILLMKNLEHMRRVSWCKTTHHHLFILFREWMNLGTDLGWNCSFYRGRPTFSTFSLSLKLTYCYNQKAILGTCLKPFII